jgi:hypothetical protein
VKKSRKRKEGENRERRGSEEVKKKKRGGEQRENRECSGVKEMKERNMR